MNETANDASGAGIDKASNINTDLLELASQFAALARATSSEGAASQMQSSFASMTLVGDGVVVDFIAAPGQAEALLLDLEALGLTHGASFGRVVSGVLPIEASSALEGMANLTNARQPGFDTGRPHYLAGRQRP